MAEYTLIFDGGSIGNPGRAYGSYRLQRAGDPPEPAVRLNFGRGTNNEAEYQAVIEGLKGLLGSVEPDESPGSLQIHGDSRLVIHQLRGDWKVKSDRLRPLHAQALKLMARFPSVKFVHQPRWKSVRTLGH